MMLSDLDGLLHGVICSPSPISSDVWMTAGLGAEPKELPNWVVNTLTDRYMEIAQGLAHDPMAVCLLHTSPGPRDVEESRMPSSA